MEREENVTPATPAIEKPLRPVRSAFRCAGVMFVVGFMALNPSPPAENELVVKAGSGVLWAILSFAIALIVQLIRRHDQRVRQYNREHVAPKN